MAHGGSLPGGGQRRKGHAASDACAKRWSSSL
jgi:hypothetical protein